MPPSEIARAQSRSAEFCEQTMGGHLVKAPGDTGPHPGACVPVGVEWTTLAEVEAARHVLRRQHERRQHERTLEAERAARRDPKEWAKNAYFAVVMYWPITLGVAALGGAWWLKRRKKR